MNSKKTEKLRTLVLGLGLILLLGSSQFLVGCQKIGSGTESAADAAADPGGDGGSDEIGVDCDSDGLGDAAEIAENAFMDSNEDGTLDSCQGLYVDGLELSAADGGVQTIRYEAGEVFAGQVYLLIGSTTGDSPGFDAFGFHFPIEADDYYNFTVAHPNTPPLGDSLGTLDTEGKATITFTVSPGTNPDLVGTTFHHAVVVLDQFTLSPLAVSSIAVRARLVD